MGFKKNSSWSEPAADGSKMKTSDAHGVLRTERISSESKPHSHDIVAVDRPTGQVKEISKGSNRPGK